MNSRIAFVVLLSFFVGCTSQQTDQLTQQQKDEIIKEVKAVADSITARCERLDSTWFDYYSDSPDWTMFNSDGKRWDYQTAKASQSMWAALASYKCATSYQHFTVLAKDVVTSASLNKVELAMKSGDKITYDPLAWTLVFKRIDGKWKVVYSHDSGVAVVRQGGKN